MFRFEEIGSYYEVVTFPEQTLEDAKAAKLAEINGACDGILKDAVKTYTDTEMMTFDQQISDAKVL